MPTTQPSPQAPAPQVTAARALVRVDGTYRRRGAERTAAAELSPRELVVAHELTHRHTHARRWSERDRAIRDELVARTWGVGELSRLRDTRSPRWLDPIVAAALPSGRHRAAWSTFLGWLCASYAAGSLGLLATFDELAAELGCSRRTWARWRGELARAGLVEVVATWDEPTDGREILRNRERAANLYRLGPKFHELALAALELAPAGSVDDRTRNVARAAAARARKAARAHRRDVELATRAATRAGSPAPAPLAEPPPPPSSSPSSLDAVTRRAELVELVAETRAAAPIGAPPQDSESAKTAPRPAPVPGSPTASTSPGHRPGGASGRSPTDRTTQRATHAPIGAAARVSATSSTSSARRVTASSELGLDVAEPELSRRRLSEGSPGESSRPTAAPPDRDGRLDEALAALREIVTRPPPPPPSASSAKRGETREAATRELARVLDSLAVAVAERERDGEREPPER